MALKIPPARRDEALEALWAREMLTGIYAARWLCGTEESGTRKTVLAFVADPRHPQYAGGLTDDERATCIVGARGVLGSCLEYLEQSVSALRAAGISDPGLDAMTDKVHQASNRAPQATDAPGAL